jgi:serine/threonine protein kinase
MVGQVLAGRYEIRRELGQGGFGSVYLAADTRTSGSLWAIKALNLTLGAGAQGEHVLELFDREQKMLSWLSHPAIVRRREVFQSGSRLYLVMEYVDGLDLRHIVNHLKRGLPQPTVINLAQQICDILAYLHAQKPHPIVFRDLKPSNLILTRDNKVKLGDRPETTP